MFSSATYPHTEQDVSPLISSVSHELDPQMEHGLKTDSVFLLSDGLIEGIIAPLLPVLAGSSALELRELLESSSIMSTNGCIVIAILLKPTYKMITQLFG